MHKVLTVPELLHLIFTSLSRNDQGKVACVCRAWVDIARDHIWETVTDPCELFEILAPMEHVGDPSRNTYSAYRNHKQHKFARRPTVADWARFEKISRRVRRLQFPSFYNSSDDDDLCSAGFAMAFADVASSRPLLHVFPGLRALEWLRLADPKEAAYHRLFLHERVHSLAIPVLHYAADAPNYYPFSVYLQDIFSTAPNITDFSFSRNIREGRQSNTAGTAEQQIMQVVDHVPWLCSLELPNSALTTSIAERLARLQNLKSIKFSYDHPRNSVKRAYADDYRCLSSHPWQLPNITPLNPALEPASFIALVELSISATLQDLVALITNANFPSSQITTFLARSFSWECEPAVCGFFKAVGRCMPALTVFTTSITSARKSQETHEDSEQQYLTVKSLDGILSLRQLEDLELRHWCPLRISNADVIFLAKMLPPLRSLCLAPYPVDVAGIHLTVHALVAFAVHLPSLQTLRLAIRVDLHSFSNLSEDPAPFHVMQCLDFGMSSIEADAIDAMGIFLARMSGINNKLQILSGLKGIRRGLGELFPRGYKIKSGWKRCNEFIWRRCGS
ncbi:hypothetical protein FA95DRAFT_73642 [Auriscalpium vulgare]|uniref:Uncharacterized protein n=1 Tax=Auriscalpium vulgare TaxID=40419 RepID=A0ACB8RPF8_9AGAM|nr:hypothetical protein FA95DRAFT_73642 [Auriscalpium vulgare]